MRRPSIRLFAASLAALLVLAAAPVRAQISAVSFGAGVMDFDLSGTGQTLTLNLRAEAPLSGALLLEPGVVFARPEQQGFGRTTLIIPEVQLQAQLPMGGFRPYLGAGVGIGLGFAGEDAGGNELEVALSGAAGVRVDYGGLLGFVLDGRVHTFGIDFDGGATLELTLGVRLRR